MADLFDQPLAVQQEAHDGPDLHELYLELRGLHEARGCDPDHATRRAVAQLRHYLRLTPPPAWRDEAPRHPSPRTVSANKVWEKTYKKRGGRPPQTPQCRCGATATRTVPGVAMHAGHVECDACGRFLRWLRKAEAV